MGKIYYVLMGLLLLGLFIIYLSFDIDYVCSAINKSSVDTSWWNNALLNIGAGIITSILVILFYDLVLLKDAKKERLARNQIALDALSDLLKSHFEAVLFGMYRAAVEEEKTFNSLEDFFYR